ncbi:MAG: (Fe-S)-binding protein [Ignavibacteria bacterium]|nr:(Fe-S)-binding protein [Ignavibacteria bacterium]
MDLTAAPFLGIPEYALLWALSAVCIGLFALRIAFFVRILRLAKPESRLHHIGKRLRMVMTDVLVQPRFFDRTSAVHAIVWPVHLVIFWGFVCYAVTFGWSLVKGLVPGLPIPWPEEIPIVATLVDLFGGIVLVALAIAAFRRYALRPRGVKRTVDAGIILVLIALVMLTSLAGAAAGIAGRGEATPEAWLPFAGMLAGLFTPSGAPALQHAFWWSHMGIVLGFLAYLPYSKHFHLLASPFGVFLGQTDAIGKMRADDSAEVEGRFDLRDFTWRELLTPLACAECGRCDRACPSYNSGEALSPQDLVHGLKEHVLAAGPLLLRANGGAAALRPAMNGAFPPDAVWACATCASCMEHCPVRNEHLPLITRARRRLVSHGAVDAHLRDTLTAFARYGNSFGQSERARAKWTQGLPFRLKDARKEPVDVLWFVGDYASYDVRVQNITRAVATLFDRAGLDVGILYDAERNAGNDARRIGEEGMFEMLAEKNVAALSHCTYNRIVTTDPHSYNTLRNEYPDYGLSAPVVHHTELLLDLVRGGALRVSPLSIRATYHDPCYLGRYNGVYDAPRALLRAVGVELAEMPRNRRDGYCCGAGGGRIWMEDRPGSGERPAESRVREAVALGDVTVLVSACPKDIVMFQDALKTTGNEGALAVRDVAELVLQAAAAFAPAAQEV